MGEGHYRSCNLETKSSPGLGGCHDPRMFHTILGLVLVVLAHRDRP